MPFSFKKENIILDVTSRSISAFVASSKGKEAYKQSSLFEEEHTGFENAEWFDLDDATATAESVLKKTLTAHRKKARTLYITVPAEFCNVISKDVAVRFDRLRKVVDADIEYLINKGNDFDDKNFKLIGTSLIACRSDVYPDTYIDVRGLTANRIEASVTYMFALNSFIEMFDEIAENAGFKDTRYICTPWAEGLALFDTEARSLPITLLDIGYLSTSISVVVGEGLSFLKYFSLGGAHISGELMSNLEVSFEEAERVRGVIDLNLAYGDDDIMISDGERTVYAADVCDIVKLKLEEFASLIKPALDEETLESPLYLTGEGITSMRGASKYLSECLDHPVEVVASKLPEYAKAELTSRASAVIVADKLSRRR
jgi:cell division ATPase FtsA